MTSGPNSQPQNQPDIQSDNQSHSEPGKQSHDQPHAQAANDSRNLWVGWDEYHRLIERLALTVHESRWPFDNLLCLARGGLRVGDQLSRIFDLPLAILATSSYREAAGTVRGDLDIAQYITMTRGELSGNVLLVDDLVDSGLTLARVRAHLGERYPAITAVRSAVLWYKGCSAVKPDYHVEFLPTNPWIHQPFEEWGHAASPQSRCLGSSVASPTAIRTGAPDVERTPTGIPVLMSQASHMLVRKQAMPTLAVAAIGVVFGDIGTSPLYSLKEAFSPDHGIPLTHQSILGVDLAVVLGDHHRRRTQIRLVRHARGQRRRGRRAGTDGAQPAQLQAWNAHGGRTGDAGHFRRVHVLRRRRDHAGHFSDFRGRRAEYRGPASRTLHPADHHHHSGDPVLDSAQRYRSRRPAVRADHAGLVRHVDGTWRVPYHAGARNRGRAQSVLRLSFHVGPCAAGLHRIGFRCSWC